jgi:predicted ABC-type ATPase
VKEAHCPDFVNVDLIAAGLSPFDPERAAIRAGRIMLSEIQHRVRKDESFAFETTLSGRVYARLIPEWRGAGYRVKLIFLSLPNPEIAIARVAARVARVVTMWLALSFVVALNRAYATFKTFI